jgi:CRP/FNR family cyclic AMP-dependent transcriptional regulator
MLREMAGQLRSLAVLVEDLAFRSVRERLARELLREAREGGSRTDPPGTGGTNRHGARNRRESAAPVSAGRGLCAWERGRIVVLDPDGLARVGNGE